MSPWVKLGIAIAVEVTATIALRQSDGLSNPWWTALMVVGYVTSFWLLSQITGQLEIGTIYAIWSGAGTAIVAVLGVWLFSENLSALKVGGLVMIILGVAALNLAGGHGEGKAGGPEAQAGEQTSAA
ncbi:MAG: multidrug efflux SMR transporter [Solirubrobacteraceae bacterium]|nr:multidrug efflux SMR transporter [Solirubrobacteraceae bacterium]